MNKKRRRLILHNKAPIWNEASQVYSLFFTCITLRYKTNFDLYRSISWILVVELHKNPPKTFKLNTEENRYVTEKKIQSGTITKKFFLYRKVAFESFFENCKIEILSLVQLFFNLLNKLLHKINCFKEAIFILELAKICSKSNF